MTKVKAVWEALLCPVVLFGWNHKPHSEKNRCAALDFCFASFKQMSLGGRGCENWLEKEQVDAFQIGPKHVH